MGQVVGPDDRCRPVLSEPLGSLGMVYWREPDVLQSWFDGKGNICHLFGQLSYYAIGTVTVLASDPEDEQAVLQRLREVGYHVRSGTADQPGPSVEADD